MKKIINTLIIFFTILKFNQLYSFPKLPMPNFKINPYWLKATIPERINAVKHELFMINSKNRYLSKDLENSLNVYNPTIIPESFDSLVSTNTAKIITSYQKAKSAKYFITPKTTIEQQKEKRDLLMHNSRTITNSLKELFNLPKGPHK